jgi:CRISPR/Cas system CSM-associated protein Csm2 small subunit
MKPKTKMELSLVETKQRTVKEINNQMKKMIKEVIKEVIKKATKMIRPIETLCKNGQI